MTPSIPGGPGGGISPSVPGGEIGGPGGSDGGPTPSTPGGGTGGPGDAGGGDAGTGGGDQPLDISGATAGGVQEDVVISVSGQLTASEPEGVTWSVVGSGDSPYGHFTLGPDGTWTYALDNDKAQGLKAGDTAQELFTVKVTDADGTSVTQVVTVSITGTNDVPVISGTAAGAVEEDAVPSVSGVLTASDADIGDSAAWSLASPADGGHGTLTLGDDGAWSYALDNDAVQGLRAGETVQDLFTVTVTDAAGASVTQVVTITVTGTNDVPVISGAETGAVEEDGSLTASGQLVSTDADIGDTAAWSIVGDDAGRYGTLTLGDDGQWSYTLDNDAAQGLKAGETAQEIFTVQVTDAEGASATQTVTITVTGTNDAPVISGAETGVVQEDEALTASGTLTASDADVGDTASWSVVGSSNGSYGALVLGDDGQWSYTLDNDAAQGLKAGETAQEIFTVQVTDAEGASATQTVTITVTGTNDTPVISGTETGMVQEDEALTASGSLTVTDPDIGDSASWSLVGSADGSYGALTLNPDGSWSYTLDNDAAQGLKAGETAQEIFTVQVTDASGATDTQTVTITVTGTNDAPVISGTETGMVQEDGGLTASGALTSADADIGDSASWSMVGPSSGSYGALVLGNDGQWSYTLDNDAAQGLKAGETVQEIFTVQVTDASGATDTQTVTITVAGTNDAPVISGAETGVVQEDEALTTSGTLTVVDPDIGDTAAWSVVGSADGSYGALTLNPDGSWSYTLDNAAAQGLKAGETAQEIFTVQVRDASGASDTQTITVTVSGTNDTPVISGSATGAVGEDGVLTASGALASTDADIGDTAAWSVVGADDGAYGSLTLDADGHWSYALDNAAAQGLKAGETVQEIFTVQVTDASGASALQTITVTVTGTNDVPAISGAETGAVQEDGALTAGGSLIVSDADVGDTASWSVVGDGAGSYGDFVLGADGSWTYALDNGRAQELNAGETAQDIFTVKVTDAAGASTTQTVTVTVTGTNDAPVISGTATGFVAEDGTLTAGGKLDVFDADTGDTASWSVVGGDSGTYGVLSIDENGRWSYALDNGKAQGLRAGETAEETFTVRVTDAHGASAEQTITVTVSGTNDMPVISGTATGQVQEDVTLTASGTLTAADADIGDTASWSIDGSATSDHGVFAIDPDSGQWTFTLDNDYAQSLKAGEVVRETFTVRVTDSEGASETRIVSIEITGTNDGPQVGQALNNMGAMKEDTSVTFSAEDLLRGAKVTDIDQDHLTITSVSLDGSSAPGTLVDNGDGTWTFTPDHNVSNANAQIVFQVSDGHQSVSAQASVAIQPVADPADVSISSSAIQEVIRTGGADDLGRIVAPQLTTKQLSEFTLEFTVVGNSVPESTTGAGPVIVNIGSPPSDKNTLTLWDPANMKVGMSKPGGGDINIATGVDLTDGQSHRVTLTWDAASNTLRVYDNGDLALTTQLPKPLPSSLYMSVAEKANTPPTTANPSGGGYRANEHFEGTIFNVAMSNKAETAEQVKDAPLAEQMKDNLLIDLRAQNDKIVDTTGRNAIRTAGAIDTDALQVDTNLGSAPAGAVVHLDIDTRLEDPNDHITSLVVSGFVAGTVVSDGVHSVTVTGPKQAIDITNWSRDNLTADLPDGVHTSMDLKVTATTTTPPFETGAIGPQGEPVTATDSATSDGHHTLLVEGAGPPPAPSTDEAVPAAPAPGDDQAGAGDTVVVPGSELGDSDTASSGTSSGEQQAKPGSSEEGGGTTTPSEGGASPSDGSDTVAGPADGGTAGGSAGAGTDVPGGGTTTGTEPPVSAGGGETTGGTTAPPVAGTETGDGGTAIGTPDGGSGSGTTSGTEPPVSAGGGDTTDGPSTSTPVPPTAGVDAGDGSTTTGSPGVGTDGGSGGGTTAGTEPPVSAGGEDGSGGASAGTTEPPAAGTEPGDGGAAGGSPDTATGSGGDETVTGTEPPASAGGEDTTGGTSAGAGEPPVAGAEPGDGAAIGTPDTGTNVPDGTGAGTAPPASAGGGDATGETATGTTPPPATSTEPGDGGASAGSPGTDAGTAGGETVAGGGETGGEAPATPQPGGDAGSGAATPDDGAGVGVAPPAAAGPVDAGGQISLVSVNDWYNPSWGGGYNATFQLTLTEDMLKGGGVEGWSLQIGVNNPSAVVSTGWLDGFNGTVAFDPATGVFTNEGQSYQPELHAGDIIQFTVQVQNTGFNMEDFSFSFQNLDPNPEGTADGTSAAVGTASLDSDLPADGGDVAAVSLSAVIGAQTAQVASPAGETEAGAQHQPAASADAHADAQAGAAPSVAPGVADAGPLHADTPDLTPPQEAGAAPDADQAAASAPSPADAYLELVQPQAEDHAAAPLSDQLPSGAAEYLDLTGGAEHMAQEPPPPDQLFADAQVEHGPAGGDGGPDTQTQATHDDAAAATAPEPITTENDQSHQGH